MSSKSSARGCGVCRQGARRPSEPLPHPGSSSAAGDVRPRPNYRRDARRLRRPIVRSICAYGNRARRVPRATSAVDAVGATATVFPLEGLGQRSPDERQPQATPIRCGVRAHERRASSSSSGPAAASAYMAGRVVTRDNGRVTSAATGHQLGWRTARAGHECSCRARTTRTSSSWPPRRSYQAGGCRLS